MKTNKLRFFLAILAFLSALGAVIKNTPVDPSLIPVQGWDPMKKQCLIGEIDGNVCSLTNGTILCKFYTSINATTFDEDCRFPIKVYRKEIDI